MHSKTAYYIKLFLMSNYEIIVNIKKRGKFPWNDNFKQFYIIQHLIACFLILYKRKHSFFDFCIIIQNVDFCLFKDSP